MRVVLEERLLVLLFEFDRNACFAICVHPAVAKCASDSIGLGAGFHGSDGSRFTLSCGRRLQSTRDERTAHIRL